MTTSTALAPIFEPFITAFERKVAEKQKEINDIKKQETIYLKVQNIMRYHDHLLITHETNIELNYSSVSVIIRLLPDDRLSSYIPMIQDIGRSIRSNDPVPALDQTYEKQFSLYWFLANSWVDIIFRLPDKGTKDIKPHTTKTVIPEHIQERTRMLIDDDVLYELINFK
jgi:hypothetical protein